MNLCIETEQEADGRWIAEVPAIPGALVYAPTREEAIARVKALALRIIADRVENMEPVPNSYLLSVHRRYHRRSEESESAKASVI